MPLPTHRQPRERFVPDPLPARWLSLDRDALRAEKTRLALAADAAKRRGDEQAEQGCRRAADGLLAALVELRPHWRSEGATLGAALEAARAAGDTDAVELSEIGLEWAEIVDARGSEAGA